MPRERGLSVVIVGAGFGGLAAAIELRRHGFDDVTVLERAAGVGGTWHYNDYPGCACDVPSHLYSFSFAQRRHWSRICSPQAEILRYLEEVARDEGVAGRVRHGVDVTSCRWDGESSTWAVSSADGRTWRADAVVIATGQLHQPAIPRVDGFSEFQGRGFHSARWNHDYDLTGKRVAVIGTGASAVQFIPEVAEQVGRLYVFQRTGNWFLPRRNRAYPAVVRGVIRFVPGVQALRRRFIYYYAETLTMMIRNPRTVGRIGRLRSALFMRWQLPDPEVRRKAWPRYTFGCKRVLFSSHYLPALQRPNVDLVVEPIERFVGAGVVTADGVLREVDCVIWGTGFKTTEFMFPMEIVGAGGRSLREAWTGGARAHLGVCVPGFPSLFLMYGPNTNTSGGSIVFYEEAQAAYIRQALSELRSRRAGSISIRPEVEAASDREVQAAFAGTAWTQCDSWYRDESGRIVANWPGYMTQYAERLRVLDPRDYEFAPPGAAPTLETP
ncbi:MAG TPA: NAD(P)/FAD-dependent oxidoreductase [Solirubrobacteraceae bacterium]|jgi:cation diffusion facilitator CzcD-associated flavoprotein CzcO